MKGCLATVVCTYVGGHTIADVNRVSVNLPTLGKGQVLIQKIHQENSTLK